MAFKRLVPVMAGLLLACAALWAADSASFVDLGFSPDGKIYMFAQYGVKSNNLRPWADLFLVDVAKNDFVPEGRILYTHDSPILAGQDGSGVLHHLVMKNSSLAKKYQLEYPNQGQPLYIALDGDPAYKGDTITFRDFTSGILYRASVLETMSGTGKNQKSSFYINLELIYGNGEEKNFRVGSPEIQRSLITSYRIKKALISPDGNSLIFVIEMKRSGDSGPDIRYMVEAIRF